MGSIHLICKFPVQARELSRLDAPNNLEESPKVTSTATTTMEDVMTLAAALDFPRFCRKAVNGGTHSTSGWSKMARATTHTLSLGGCVARKY